MKDHLCRTNGIENRPLTEARICVICNEPFYVVQPKDDYRESKELTTEEQYDILKDNL